MKILALDTATENCSAALYIDGAMQSREIEMERGHAERILPMVDELLSEAGITLRHLDAIAFGRGPGSFTGVRLAVTVTQGLAFGAGLGVVPISDLQAVAQRALRTKTDANRLLVCNDARMSEVYWACFERTPNDGMALLVGEELVSKPIEVKLPSSWPNATVTAVGRGFTAYSDALRSAVPSVTVGDELTRLLPHAIDIARLAIAAVTANRLLAPEDAMPIYLRDNVAHVAQSPRPPSGHAA